MKKTVSRFAIPVLTLMILSFGFFQSRHVHALDIGDVYGSCPSCGSGRFVIVDPMIDPSCTQEGMAYAACESCGYGETVSIPALGHDYVAKETKAATCTESGTVYYQCSRCEDSYRESIPALGHSYASEVISEPTCTAAGTMRYTCRRCGDSYDDTIHALGHDYEISIGKEPTCTQAGSEDHVCRRCGDSYHVNMLALGHSYVKTVTREATCEEDGLVTYTCSRCNDTYTKKTDALGHDYETEEKAATCTEDGEKTSTCKRCGKVEKQIIKAIGHDPDHFVTVKEPTCTEDGKRTAVCKRCNEELEEVIPKLGHSYPDEWTIEKEATYLAEGREYKECQRCHERMEQIIPKKDASVLIAIGTGLLALLGGAFFFLKKRGLRRSIETAEKKDIPKPDFEDKSVLVRCENEDFIALLKDKSYLEVKKVEEDLISEAQEMGPDLLIVEADSYQRIKKLIDLKEDELKDIALGLIVPEKPGKKTAELLKKAKKEKKIVDSVGRDEEDHRKFVKLVLPVLKPDLKSDESLGNIGMVADLLGIPGVSKVIDVYVSGRDIKATLEEGELGVSGTATIIGDIASILGLDTVASVAGLVDDVDSIRAALDKESGAYEEKSGLEASGDIVDVVSDLIDKD